MPLLINKRGGGEREKKKRKKHNEGGLAKLVAHEGTGDAANVSSPHTTDQKIVFYTEL